MKSLILLLALLFVVTLTSTSNVNTKASPEPRKQRAIAQFNQPVRLLGVMLKGEYLFVHDDEAMMRGEACTYVYKGNAAIDHKLVVSFHCIPQVRWTVNNFTLRTVDVAGVSELREYQFKGDTEAHLVPTGK